MSGFVNPFAQVGDYRDVRLSADSELVTTAYLTGLPDPRKIADEQAGIIFKQMLKRDSRTKQRALRELEIWLDGKNSGSQIEDEVHLAYVQMYSKLSIDNSAQIRSSSHVVLKKLYTLLSKGSSKYLKYSVGPWVTSLYDPDQRAENSAREALTAVFPGNKSQVLIEKFKDAIQSFIFDACTNATAQTLSDERYVTKDEASQKYTRLVKCCLDALAANAVLLDTESWEVSQLVDSGVIWKFFSSSDGLLARSALRLAHANINRFNESVPLIWKELLRAGRKNVGGPGIAVEIIQLMNVCTKQYPEETWPADENTRKDALASLGQFIAMGSPHTKNFWPLLYNLSLMIPEPPTRDLTPLYKPIEKAVLKLKYNIELEESAWGCFISLAGKMGPKFVHKAFKAAEMRCQSPNVPVDSIAKFLARFATADGVYTFVEAQLQSPVPFEYAMVLARTHAFSDLIETLLLPSLAPRELVLLFKADSGLKIPPELEVTADPEWLDIAATSHSANSQSIVEKLSKLGLNLDILKMAPTLYTMGVRISLDSFVNENLADIEVLVAAVTAQDSFVSKEVAGAALEHLVRVTLDDEKHMNDLLRAVRSQPDFVKLAASANETISHGLEALSTEDTHGVLKMFSGLNISSSAAASAEPTQENELYLTTLDLDSLDLSIPEENVINPLRAPVPQTTKGYTDGLAEVNELAERVLFSISNKPPAKADKDMAVKIAVLNEFFKSWEIVSPYGKDSDLQNALSEIRELDSDVDVPKLWDLAGSANYSVAYHASMAIASRGKAVSGIEDLLVFRREYFVPPSLHGALVAYLSPTQESSQYDSLQRSLQREAVSGRLGVKEYMIVDQKSIPEHLTVEVDASAEGEGAVKAVFQIGTFASRVVNLEEVASSSTSHIVECAALLATSSTEALDTPLNFAFTAPQETLLDAKVSRKCLSLVNVCLETYPGLEHVDSDIWDPLAETYHNSLTINWIALQLVRYSKLSPDLSTLSNITSPLTASKVVSWLILLNFLPHEDISDKTVRDMFDWITESIKRVRPDSLSSEIIDLPSTPPESINSAQLALNALFNLCVSRPNAVREWYRDLRDRALVKNVDQLLSTLVIPRILGSVRAEVTEEKFGADTDISVNEKQREIRASREVEDEFTVDIVISLPEQYPGKPAVVTVRNLAGVSEAKKRGWLLEARQNIQNKGLVEALSGLLTRLNNFLDGIEPCAICYMTVNDLNKLPNKDCSQCHNIYHSDCLYKWFSTNGNKLCPMCRSPM